MRPLTVQGVATLMRAGSLKRLTVMLPLLLFPVVVPVLLGAVNATTLTLQGDVMGETGLWVRLLVAFDIIFFVVCVWIFPVAVEE